MALYRTISMAFWTDSKIVDDFTPEDKYFYLYLFTNPHTNLCGCYEISIKQIVNEIGYSDDSVRTLIRRFEEIHKVIRYCKETKEILLLNWHKYNWSKSDKFLKALRKEIKGIKCEVFKQYYECLVNGEDTVSIRYPYCIDTSITNTNTITNAYTISHTGAVEPIGSNEDVTPTLRKKKPVKHKHGEYNNVLLTDEEYQKLQDMFPDLQERIERLSEYVASTGKSYKSHYATIRAWARKDKKPQESRKNQEFTSDLERIAKWAGRSEDYDKTGIW